MSDRQKMNERLREQMQDEQLTDPIVYRIGGRLCIFSHIGRLNVVPDLDTVIAEFYFMPKVLQPADMDTGGVLGPLTGSYIKGKFRYDERIQPVTALAHKRLLDRLAHAAGRRYQNIPGIKLGGDTDYSDKISYE